MVPNKTSLGATRGYIVEACRQLHYFASSCLCVVVFPLFQCYESVPGGTVVIMEANYENCGLSHTAFWLNS